MHSKNFVGVTDGLPDPTAYLHWIATTTAVPALHNATHHIEVRSQHGILTVAVDGAVVLTAAVVLPPNVLIGFTASTGNHYDVQSVANLVATAPTGA
jgi:hypothetical protein